MGTADIIPGVSGGTIALITGIYERLIFGIRNIDIRNLRSIDLKFFIPLLSGITVAFLTLSGIIEFFLDSFTAPTYAFFFGLILASACVVYKHVDKLSSVNLLFSILGFLFAFLFVGLDILRINHSPPVIFFSGAVAICAMVLPGISGAFILFFLNQYGYMLRALNNLQFLDIFTFISGALLGILSFSRILSFFLERYKSFTMSFLVGLMLGALRMPLQDILRSMNSFLPVFISGLIGFFIVFILEIYHSK